MNEQQAINRTLGIALCAVGCVFASLAVSLIPTLPANVPAWPLITCAVAGTFLAAGGLHLAREVHHG